jgi:hypothetical protein
LRIGDDQAGLLRPTLVDHGRRPQPLQVGGTKHHLLPDLVDAGHARPPDRVDDGVGRDMEAALRPVRVGGLIPRFLGEARRGQGGEDGG